MEMSEAKLVKIEETMDNFFLQQDEILEARLKKIDKTREAEIISIEMEMADAQKAYDYAIRRVNSFNQSARLKR